MIKDIRSDSEHNKMEDAEGEYQRISFSHFKIKQNEIETQEDLIRVQSKPVRRNNPRFIKWARIKNCIASH